MSAAESPILVDESGRRRRRLRAMGRVVSALLIAWLGILALGALGLQPLGGLPIVGLVPGRATPSALPARVEAAVRERRALVWSPRGVGRPGGEVAAPSGAKPMPALGVGGPAIGLRPGVRHARGGGSTGTRTPTARRAPGGSRTVPAQPTTSTGTSGTTPAATTPAVPPASGGTGTTTPVPPAPGSSGTAPGQTIPASPPRGRPSDPGSAGAGRTSTTPSA